MGIEKAGKDLNFVRQEFKDAKLATFIMRTGLRLLWRHFGRANNLDDGVVQSTAAKIGDVRTHLDSSKGATEEGMQIFIDAVGENPVGEKARAAGAYALRLLEGEAGSDGASLEIINSISDKLAAMKTCLQEAHERSEVVVNHLDMSRTALDSVAAGPLANVLEALDEYRKTL